MNPTITRKELSELTGLSVRTIKRNEQVWGLRRVVVVTRTVLYSRSHAVEKLTAAGFDLSRVCHHRCQ